VRRCTSAGSSWWAFEQLGDGGPAQRRELHAAHTRRGDEIAHHRAQRGIGADRVAARHDHQQRQRVDAAGEEAHEVGGRLVGPVQVFHDEHAGRLAQGVQHGGEDLVLGRRVAQACGDGGPEAACDVAQRAERARGCSTGRTCPTAPASTPAPLNARKSAVLPMPASPTSSTRPPRPAAARSARVCSTSIGCSRSSSRTNEV
jgi:hypothetical protein